MYIDLQYILYYLLRFGENRSKQSLVRIQQVYYEIFVIGSSAITLDTLKRK